MKHALVLVLTVFAFSAHAKIDVSVGQASAFASGQDAEDLVTALVATGLHGDNDVMGNPEYFVSGEVIAHPGVCANKKVYYSVRLREFNGDDLELQTLDLDLGADQCAQSNQAAKFKQLIDAWAVAQISDAIGSKSFNLECGHGYPKDQPAYVWCNVRASAGGGLRQGEQPDWSDRGGRVPSRD